MTCHSSSTPVVRPSAPVKERHYSTAPAVRQSKPVPHTTNPVSNAVSDISSQQMIMTVLESSVATAIFMGLIFLLLLVVLARYSSQHLYTPTHQLCHVTILLQYFLPLPALIQCGHCYYWQCITCSVERLSICHGNTFLRRKIFSVN